MLHINAARPAAGQGMGGSIGGELEGHALAQEGDDESPTHAGRSFRGPPGLASREGSGLEGNLRRLRPVALKRIKRLMETSGELPPEGYPGIMLPPLPIRFLADELGVRMELVQHLLQQLNAEGVLQEVAGQYLVPRPSELSRSPLS